MGKSMSWWKIKKTWEIAMPNVTEIFARFLPFGTTANDSSGSGGIRIMNGTDELEFVNMISSTLSNVEDKVWAIKSIHIVLDNGIAYAETSASSSNWDFTSNLSGQEMLFFPRSTVLENITSLILDGYNRYIGAGSKIKVWAR